MENRAAVSGLILLPSNAAIPIGPSVVVAMAATLPTTVIAKPHDSIGLNRNGEALETTVRRTA
jgi:hypothetical protein